jgi:hypothetical protein
MWRNSVIGGNAQWLMNGPAVAVSSSLPSVDGSFQVITTP